MKKLLFFAALCCAFVSCTEENEPPTPTPPGTDEFEPIADSYKFGRNDIEVGYFTGDLTTSTFDFTAYPGEKTIGTVISPNLYDTYCNATLKAVRLAVSSALENATLRIQLIDKDGNYGEVLHTQELTDLKAGWSTITLDKQIPMPTDPKTGLFVGYSYYQTSDANPVALYKNTDTTSGCLIYGNFKEQGTGWFSLSNNGVLALRLLVEADAQAEGDVRVTDIRSNTTLINESNTATITLSSNNAEPVENIDYEYIINGHLKTGHYDFAKPLAAGYGQQTTLTIPFTSPSQAGTNPIRMRITQVNGKQNHRTDIFEAACKTLSRRVARMNVVEEFTGTTCGYCPRGWIAMESLKESLSDRTICIAIHQYQSSDPMYTANYYPLRFTGAPSACVNRTYFTNFSYDGKTIRQGIADEIKAITELPEASVNISARYNADQTAVNIEAETELLTDGNYSIAFVLTGDEMESSLMGWRQTNYYYQYTKTQAGNDPDLNEFCSGGSKGTSSLKLTYNDVLINSSWQSANDYNNDAPALKACKAGTKEKTAYTIAMPASTSKVAKGWNLEKVNAIALIMKEDGTITQAARCHVQ